MNTETGIKKGTGAFKIAFILIGSIVGAGFASGREIWVYFASFGEQGYLGLVFAILLYIFMAGLSVELSYRLHSEKYEVLIVPAGHEKLTGFIKYYVMACIWVAIMSMSAGGGSMGEELFGVSKYIGGLVVVVLVLVTVLGNFDRVSKILGYVMPILMVTLITTCIYLKLSDIPDPGATAVPMHGSLTPTWYIAAFIYMSFGLTGIFSINVSCASEAKSKKSMYGGILITALFLLILAGLMISILSKYPSFTEELSLPMPGYAALVSPTLHKVFSVAIMCSIYSAATTGYYAFTVALKDDKYKKIKVVGFALLGYFLGLMGFKNVVNYVFSIKGIVSILLLVLMIINFVKVMPRKGQKTEETE